MKSRAKTSLYVYAVYLGSGGLVMMLIPNTMLRLVNVPETREVWIRVFGALAFVLAVKGANGARLNLYSSMRFDVFTRTFFATVLTVLVLVGISPRILIILAIIDYAAALWTELAVRADQRAGVPGSRDTNAPWPASTRAELTG